MSFDQKTAQKARKMSHFCTIVHVPDSDPYNGTCIDEMATNKEVCWNVASVSSEDFDEKGNKNMPKEV